MNIIILNFYRKNEPCLKSKIIDIMYHQHISTLNNTNPLLFMHTVLNLHTSSLLFCRQIIKVVGMTIGYCFSSFVFINPEMLFLYIFFETHQIYKYKWESFFYHELNLWNYLHKDNGYFWKKTIIISEY